VLAPDNSTALEIRPATDADWPAISLLDATSFGRFGHPESLAAWGVADAEQHRPRARRTPTGAGADIHTDLDVLGACIWARTEHRPSPQQIACTATIPGW
jgi:hypothetical protein